MSQSQVNATHAGFADTMRVFEIQAGQITVQEREIKRARDEIESILGDCRAFVTQTQAQAAVAKTEMIQQVEALHAKPQNIVKFVDDVPEAVIALQEKLNAVTEWCAVNSLDTVPVAVICLQEKLDALTAQVDHRMTQLTNQIPATRAAVGSTDFGYGFGTGKGRAAQTARDRNAFDPRDYKVAELGNKPSMATWKKWCRNFECFVDTIGPSWKGTSGLLRQLRF